ncbi:hypothetical protein DRZ77_03485 [Candidatus Woesearchaeota archaeon]|nr:MAG: hypothetical protein DRZ77_03485 [Candidatus Woesearchaeota archaeon]
MEDELFGEKEKKGFIDFITKWGLVLFGACSIIYAVNLFVLNTHPAFAFSNAFEFFVPLLCWLYVVGLLGLIGWGMEKLYAEIKTLKGDR